MEIPTNTTNPDWTAIPTTVAETVKNTTETTKAHVYRIKNSQIATAIMGGIGTIFFVLGIERLVENMPLLSNPYVEIVLGLALLSASGLLIKKLSGSD